MKVLRHTYLPDNNAVLLWLYRHLFFSMPVYFCATSAVPYHKEQETSPRLPVSSESVYSYLRKKKRGELFNRKEGIKRLLSTFLLCHKILIKPLTRMKNKNSVRHCFRCKFTGSFLQNKKKILT